MLLSRLYMCVCGNVSLLMYVSVCVRVSLFVCVGVCVCVMCVWVYAMCGFVKPEFYKGYILKEINKDTCVQMYVRKHI